MSEIDYLYKYRSLDSDKAWERLSNTLIGDELYFPSPNTFNDPFDCAPVPIVRGSKNQTKTALMGLWRRMRSHLSRNERRLAVAAVDKNESHLIEMQKVVLNNLINSVGVLSLSARCDSVLMWSHYSSSHSGCCLRFKVSAAEPYFARAFPVHYQKERPQIDILRDSREERMNKSLLIKADFWNYEEEHRIIEYEGPPGV